MKRAKRLSVSLGLFLLAWGRPLVATADETKLVHGAGFCHQSGTSGILGRAFQGTLVNGSYTETLHVVCPVVRVANNESTGLACVNTVDRNTTAGIRCSFYNQRAFGHDWTWSGWKTTNGGSPDNYQVLAFGPYDSEDTFDGYHHFYCTIPPRITTYRTDPTQGFSWIASYFTGGRK